MNAHASRATGYFAGMVPLSSLMMVAPPPRSPGVAVGEVIRVLLWRRQLHVADVARAIGVAPPTASRKLAGQTPMTVAELYAIAELLDVPPAQLLPEYQPPCPKSGPESSSS